MLKMQIPTVYLSDGRKEDVLEKIIMLDCEKEVWPYGTLPYVIEDDIETNAIIINGLLTTVTFYKKDMYTGVATADEKIAEIAISMGFTKVD